jgi:hypothetical protein
MTATFLPAGTPAPPFELTAAYTHRKFSPADCLGVPFLLVFISYATREMVRAISQSVRDRYPDADQVVVANLINLDFVPRLARSTAARMIDSELKEAVKQLPAGFHPHDHLILLLDWKGSVFKAYRVGHMNDEVALVMVDTQGLIVGSYQGSDPAGAALALVEAELGDHQNPRASMSDEHE